MKEVAHTKLCVCIHVQEESGLTETFLCSSDNFIHELLIEIFLVPLTSFPLRKKDIVRKLKFSATLV